MLINGFFAWTFFSSDDVDRSPPWHPFELNSELTLESIVKAGHKFKGMPCGQVQYFKEIGDTYIQYEVEVDCNTYNGHYESDYDLAVEEFGTLVKDSIKNEGKSDKNEKPREEEIVSNKYYPWNIDEIKNCYQKVNWRYFSKSLGQSIDSLDLIDFIESNGGSVLTTARDWNSKKGGAFVVHHSESDLYFHCLVRKENFEKQGQPIWNLSIARRIPPLNQEVIKAERDRQQKVDKYYRQ